MTAAPASALAAGQDEARPHRGGQLKPSYWPFVLPALLVVGAVILFPWIFTLWMSLNEWRVGSDTQFVGLANYTRLATDMRFLESLWHTVLYTFLSVAAPLVLGTAAALAFNTKPPSGACFAASS